MPEQVNFELPDPSYEAFAWAIQDEHAPASQPPLIATANPFGRAPEADGLPTRITINGYAYARADIPMQIPFGRMPVPETVDDLTHWRTEWLPEVEKLERAFEEFDPSAVQRGTWQETLDAQEQEFRRIFAGVHRTAVGPARMAVERFLDAYTWHLGEERRGDAFALLQGIPNMSLDRAAALWDLSRLVRSSPALADALDRGVAVAGLTDRPEARQFDEQFGRLLKEFGHTTNSGMQDMPTWREDPSIPLAVIRAYSKQEDDRGPRQSARRREERRLELEQELHERARSDAATVELFPLMRMAQCILPNLEDHNLLCDQHMAAASRARWLAIGRWLRDRDVLDDAEDIFYLDRSELLPALEGESAPSKDEIARRKALQQAYRNMPPPLTLGQAPGTLAFGSEIPEEASEARVLRGAPASPGSYRGRARVIESLTEAESLEEGDILVARSTTPPWTPYFGVIAAIVTNSGGILSHGAVVAREFGIPAVVGTMSATELIPDGATIVVDGTRGIVVVEAAELG